MDQITNWNLGVVSRKIQHELNEKSKIQYWDNRKNEEIKITSEIRNELEKEWEHCFKSNLGPFELRDVFDCIIKRCWFCRKKLAMNL